MIAKPGEVISVDGKSFTVGGGIWANGNSSYAGLFGTVTEIRDGVDKGTDNDAPEIYCAFKAPENESFVEELENRFSKLSGAQRALGDIPLDSVVMAPDMLEPVAAFLPEASERLYALCFSSDGNNGIEPGTLGVSTDTGILLRLMSDDIENHVPLTLTTSTFDSDCMIFAYENTDLWDEELYINYMITPVSIYPAAEGGIAK